MRGTPPRSSRRGPSRGCATGRPRLLSSDELESIHLGSLRVLSEIGMDFLDADAREILRAAGATVEPDSQRVRFDPAMVTELIRTAPSQFTLHARNPGA